MGQRRYQLLGTMKQFSLKQTRYQMVLLGKRSASIIALSLLLTACNSLSPKKVWWECETPSGNNSGEQISTNFTPSILIDRTVSMQGFVKNPGSEYMLTLEALDRTAASINNSRPRYWGFWTERGEGGSLGEAKTPRFYATDHQDALMEKALEPLAREGRDEFSIIVTDLSRADRNKLSDMVKMFRDNLSRGYAIGILGIQSQFDGKIHDVFATGEILDYKGVRPFYVVLLGKYENVAKYFEDLKDDSGYSFIKTENFMIYNSQLVSQPSSFTSKDKPELVRGVERVPEIYTRPSSLFGKSLELGLENPGSVQQLAIYDQAQATKGQISYAVGYYPLDYTLPVVAMTNISSCLSIETPTLPKTEASTQKEVTGDRKAAFDDSFDDYCQKSLESEFLEFLDFELDKENKEIRFSVGFIESTLQDQIETTMMDISSSQTLPFWIDDWSFGEEDKGKNNDFYGSKTYNLQQLLSYLNNASNEIIEEAGIGRFCFAIHKK